MFSHTGRTNTIKMSCSEARWSVVTEKTTQCDTSFWDYSVSDAVLILSVSLRIDFQFYLIPVCGDFAIIAQCLDFK